MRWNKKQRCFIAKIKTRQGWNTKNVPVEYGEDEFQAAENYIIDWIRDNRELITTDPIELLRKEAFPAQLAFIDDPAKRKAAFVMRRGGKSYTAAIYLLITALKNPGTKSLFIASTREAAENILWRDCLFPLLHKFKIHHKYNSFRQTLELQNKSIIKLTGADASDKLITRYLGGRYITCIIDENQSLDCDIHHWIYDILGPAMIDHGGTICCMGTAGPAIGRFWYHLTQPESNYKDWSVHKWSGNDNPHMAEKLRAEMERLKAEQPGIENTEGFKNNYMCEWVIDSSARVYKFGPNNILKDEAIKYSLLTCDSKWRYILSFDFGFTDETALNICAYSKYDNTMYVVETVYETGMIAEDVAMAIRRLRQKYHPVYMVGDCQSKQFVETLRVTYKLPLVAADKQGKVAHIAAMNSDFIMNKIKVIEELNAPVIKEWNELTWDERKRVEGIFKEKSEKSNHAVDSCLYNFVFSKHYDAKPEPPPDPRSSMRIAAEERVKRQSNGYDNAYLQDCEQIYEQFGKI